MRESGCEPAQFPCATVTLARSDFDFCFGDTEATQLMPWAAYPDLSVS